MSNISIEPARSQLGRMTFMEPDTSKDPMEKPYFTFQDAKSITDKVLPLHDMREDIFSESPKLSLETHAFTAVKHSTALLSPTTEGDPFVDSERIEKIYIPEVEKMIQTLTGATKIIVIRCGLRTKAGVSPKEETPASRERSQQKLPLLISPSTTLTGPLTLCLAEVSSGQHAMRTSITLPRAYGQRFANAATTYVLKHKTSLLPRIESLRMGLMKVGVMPFIVFGDH